LNFLKSLSRFNFYFN